MFRIACAFIFICFKCSSCNVFSCEVDISNEFSESDENSFPWDNTTGSCASNTKRCLRKCCAPNKILLNSTCVDGRGKDLRAIEGFANFQIVYDFLKCFNDRILLNPKLEGNDDCFEITEFGHVTLGQLTYDQSKYCVDFLNGDDFVAYVCPIPETKTLFSAGMIISMPFLLATFLAYALLPDRNLPAKALMCYVLSLLLAYILLVTIQLSNNMANGPCVASAILCYFFFMVSFFWMNSSCIDIWLTFSGLKGLVGNRKQNENKRFVYYFIYSWGVPIILVCIVIGMTYGPHITKASQFHTGLGEGQCWFKSELPTGIYFYFPIALLLIINVILFAVTAYKINVVKKDTKMLKQGDSRAHRYENDKQRFNLYLKLLLAMGLNWTMEVISWAVNWGISSTPEAVWYLTDLCNALYGVFIFFIFVFKRNIWMLLKKRYLQLTGKPQQAHQLGISSSTARTAVSQVTSEA